MRRRAFLAGLAAIGAGVKAAPCAPSAAVATSPAPKDAGAIFVSGDGSVDTPFMIHGGWCAPTETVYDLVPHIPATTDDRIFLPELRMKRGGITFPASGGE